METQSLVDDWFSYHQELERNGASAGAANLKEVGKKFFDSIDELDQIVRVDPEQGWRIIQLIFARSENDFQRACLASGLLEDLLAEHGVEFIERIESAAQNDEGFRELLSGVWRNSIEEAVWLRLQDASLGA